MNRNTVGGATCRYTCKHRGCARRIGHSASITGGFFHAEHTGAHLSHFIQRLLFVHTWFDYHFAQFRNAFTHAQVQYQFFT